MSDNGSVEPEEQPTPEKTISIDNVIDSFLHRILDIETCAETFIPIAAKDYNENASRLASELESNTSLLDPSSGKDEQLLGMRYLRRSIRELERHNNSQPVKILETSLFISLFSAFDKYIGDLVLALYSLEPKLYKNIGREVPLSEILSYDSIEELREVVLHKESETIRRKSYAEQFSEFEGRFGLKLTQFESWSKFIEMSQRRNLFTHCDGVVSKQYLDVCKTVNFDFDSAPDIGDQLEIGNEYLFESCRIVSEVAVMLGHTLWRKTSPSNIEAADSSLNSLIFDFLHMEDWKKSISLSKFAQKLPKISTDKMERMFCVNYAIALNAIDKHSAAKNVLDKKDWTATTYDFRLAHAVVYKNYEEAGSLMQRIGKTGELVTEMAYHDWPLFKEFRERPEFFENYEAVFGYKYSSKLSSIAEEKSTEISEAEA